MYKVCILAAGKGTRNSIYNGLHKALYPINNRAAISHILDNIPNDIEIVIAVGYLADQIKTYLDFAHSDKKITYVEVNNYDGQGSGPGYSLYCCKKELQCPFIWTAADTLLFGTKFSFPNVNWVGYKTIAAKQDDKYCCVSEAGKLFYTINEYQYVDVFIGTAGVYDYNTFWETMQSHINESINNEIQVLNGFNGLEEIQKIPFDNWIDIGKDSKYLEIENNYIVQQKDNQALFIEKPNVIKFFSSVDIDKIVKRYEMFLPNVVKINNNMLGYKYIEGSLLSEENNINIFNKFIHHLIKRNNNYKPKVDLRSAYTESISMYKEKTYERIVKFIDSDLDKITKINGISVANIKETLNLVDWEKLFSSYKAVYFHGDLQPENIVLTNNDEFYYLDPRQDFGGNLIFGDLYYELGKIEHALIINGENVNKNLYSVNINNNIANLKFHLKNNLLHSRAILETACKCHDLDFDIVKLISALQFLNIAPLYTKNLKYQTFLFLLGKLRLTLLLRGEDII